MFYITLYLFFSIIFTQVYDAVDINHTYPNKMIEIDGEKYYGGDLQFLKDFIFESQNNRSSSALNIGPLELGVQEWRDGRLISLCTTSSFPEECQMDYTLVGSIPSSIGNLTHLEKLILPSNKLAGQIPDELQNLTKLKDLNLADNNFKGVMSKNCNFQSF